jgi:hypothetical protein
VTAHYFYTSPTTPGNPGWVTEILNGVRLAHGDQQGVIDQAQVGAVGASSVEVDDPDGTLDFLSDKGWHIIEDEAPIGDQRVWTGYIGDQKIGRGGENQIGAGRQWTLTLVPIESFLHFRIFEDDAANRPAETDLARITWILGYDYLSDTLYDEGLIDWTGAFNVDADDCRGKYLDEVLAALSTKSGKNHWLDYNEATGHYRLAYLFNNSATPTWDSAIRLTNIDAEVLGDDSGLTLPVLMPPDGNDAELERLSGRIVAGVREEFAGKTSGGKNYVYETNTATGNKFGFRDGLSQDSTIKTEALAIAQANKYLHDNATPDLLVHVSVWTPAHLVTAIKKGQRVQCKFSHLSTPSTPVFSDWPGWGRVIQKTIRRDKPTAHFWTIDYDIAPILLSPCDPSDSYPAHSTGPLGGPGGPSAPYSNIDLMGPYYFSAGDGMTIPSVVPGAHMHVNYPQFEWAMGGAYNGSWVDGLRGASANSFWIYCQGDGTLDLYLAGDAGAVATIYQDDYPAIPLDPAGPDSSIVLRASGSMAGPITKYSYSITSISAFVCYHLVRVEIAGPFDNGSVYFDHFTWTPA